LKLLSPPQQCKDSFPILTHSKEIYKTWHGYLNRLPRTTKHTLGVRIDNLFIDLIELALTCKFAKREERLTKLWQMSAKIDYLKYFVTILWEMRSIDETKYSSLANQLVFNGQMTGGLIASITKKKNEESGN